MGGNSKHVPGLRRMRHCVAVMALSIVALFSLALVMNPPRAEAADSEVIVYRLFNPYTTEHLITSDPDEYYSLQPMGWQGEGELFRVPKSSNTPIYRLYNPYNSDHLYTKSISEYDQLRSIGWSGEDIKLYGADNGGVPVYRMYNPWMTANGGAFSHLLTASDIEYEHNYELGWNKEGVAWYALSTGSAGTEPDQPDDPDSEPLPSVEETDYKIEQAISEAMSGTLSDEQKAAIIDRHMQELKSSGEILDAYYDYDSHTYVYHYLDGSFAIIPLNLEKEDSINLQSKDVNDSGSIQNYSRTARNLEIDSSVDGSQSSSNSVYVLDAFYGSWSNGPLSSKFVNDIKALGLDCHWNLDVGLDDLMDLRNRPEKTIVYLGHGVETKIRGPESESTCLIITNEEINDKTSSRYNSAFERGAIGGVWQAVNTLLGHEFDYKMFYTVSSKFFDSYGINDLDNKAMLFGCCQFYGCDCGNTFPQNNVLADTLLDKGAEFVLGFRNSVVVEYSVNLFEEVVTNLWNGDTISTALDEAKKIVGDNDGYEDLEDDIYIAFPILKANNPYFNPFSVSHGQTSPQSFTAVATGSGMAGVVGQDGSLWVWGNNWDSQLGSPGVTSSYKPIRLFDSHVKAVAFGMSHGAAIMDDGTLKCWGFNDSGQVGNREWLGHVSRPIDVGLHDVISVSLSSFRTCAIRGDGTVWCWGSGYESYPTQITDLPFSGARKIVTNDSTVAVITSDGALWMWGDVHRPMEYLDSSEAVCVCRNGVTDVALGSGYVTDRDFFIGYVRDGQLFMWGNNYYGQLGNGASGSEAIIEEPQRVNFPVDPFTWNSPRIKSIEFGEFMCSALTEDGTIYTWGCGSNGTLGTGDYQNQLTPHAIVNGFNGLAVYGDHAIATDTSGNVYGWGSGNTELFGINPRDDLLFDTKKPAPILIFPMIAG